MNKIFLFKKHTKAGEDCNKFSTSVSYETLVLGATTAGTVYEQTQCLSKGSADAPLDAVGTFSVIFDSAKVVEKLIHRHSETKLKNPEKQTQSFLARCCASKKQRLSSLVRRKSEHQKKALSFLRLRGASGAQGIFAPARVLFKHLSCRFLFNLIRRSLEFFAFAQVAPAKNRDDSLLFLASPRTRFGEIATSAFCLLAMTPITLALAAVLFMGALSESLADDSTTPAEAPKLLPNTGSCGAGCLYEITTDLSGARNLRVYNDPDYIGETKNIKASAFRGNGYIGNTYYDNNYSNAVFDKIIIDGDFETIGGNAFTNTSANEVVFNGNIGSINYGAFEGNNLTSITLPQGLKTIASEAFYHNKIYSITIPDSVTEIGSFAFAPNGGGVSTVDIADTLDSLGTSWPFGINSNLSIICKGDVEKCQSLVKEYNLGNIKIVDLSDNVTGVDKEHCTGEKYFWNGTSCSRKEVYCDNNMYYNGIGCIMRPTDGSDIVCEYDLTGYLKIGDKCYSPAVTYAKKHYTPTEANQWLKDNDNTIILTFKINR